MKTISPHNLMLELKELEILANFFEFIFEALV